MTFKEVWPKVLKGRKVKRKRWGGYWRWEYGSIMMYCKNGDILDIRETDDVLFTMNNVLANDWELLPDDYKIKK